MMRRSRSWKALIAVALAVVLFGPLSPVAAGVLLCIGDGGDADCCDDGAAESDLGEAAQFLGASDCDCCIAVDAVRSTTRVNASKAASEIACGSVELRQVTRPTVTRTPGAPPGDWGEMSLSSIRTVVLLI